MSGDGGRAGEIAGNLHAVRARINEACDAAGRGAGEVTLVAVTKFFPPADAVRLLRLGVRDLGESRDQEARRKAAEVRALLPAEAAGAGRTPTCLVQVNLDPDTHGRGGAEPVDVQRIADAIAETDALRLGGLMAVAPLGADPAPTFERLAEIAAKLRGAHPEAVSLSAGMSGDLEAAIAAGATHVRIGSALLGARAPLR